MKYIQRLLFILAALFILTFNSKAEDWRDKTELLIYSPRYFGPLAFPMPQMRDGNVSKRYEVELNAEYHHYSGDKTSDIMARFLLPFIRGRAGIEVTWYIREKYKLTPETRDERFAVETESPNKYSGDIIVSSFFQVLRSERWADIVVSANLKTASGGRLCDARFTDAAAYWFDVNLARNLWKSADQKSCIRLQALAGFYCWMTNNMIHRQNDAVAYGVGLTGTYRHFTLATDLTGFHGYENNGDRPLHWRNRLSYDIKNNLISFRYTHGLKDRLYESFSLGYARCF